ncbi:hypothetical protein [Streptomyces sp. NPDC052179]|uniref:hypothetical protein n=1 Tax=Streptomyces sp. NPDC052179 TaxID=3155680 RepID=UPI00342E6109
MTARLFASAAREHPRRRWRSPADPLFWVGPYWAWCPAEDRTTPHQQDAGSRRCRSCETTTKEMTHGCG